MGFMHSSLRLIKPADGFVAPAKSKARVKIFRRASLRGSGRSTFSPNQLMETFIVPSRSLGQQFHNRPARICDKARPLSAERSASAEDQRGKRTRIAVP